MSTDAVAAVLRCPVCASVPVIAQSGSTTVIFCQPCYETGKETTTCVRFDHNIAGVGRLKVAARLWDRSLGEFVKMKEAA